MRRLAAISLLLLGVGLGAVMLAGSASGSGSPYQVRAIFDDGGFAVPGEQVRIAGAPVGSVQSLDVCTTHCTAASPRDKAAVTLAINNSAFAPFHANATCAIRPQSLIAERYVDCTPGTSAAPALSRVTSGPGSGTYLLPVTQTTSAVDSDIVQNISQEPIRQRFALILNELGTGLAARGSDLNAVVHRANPALGYTDQVFQILARENRTLAQLATDSDTVLAPLARVRQSLSQFVVQANTTAVASAARASDISRSFQLFPSFLRQLRPLMVQLGNLAGQGTPLMASLGQAAVALGHQFENLVPFAQAARPALISLGKSSQQSQPYLIATEPLARQLKSLGSQSLPSATLLARLTSSLDQTGAIEQLMALLFNGTSAANGFDAAGHYVRDQPLVGDCTGYALTPVAGCSANFGHASAAAVAAFARTLLSSKAGGSATSKAGGPPTSTPGGSPNGTPGGSPNGKPGGSPNGKPLPSENTLSGLLNYLIGTH